MNPMTKRRLPSSLRNLLTDIYPKEEWTDLDPDLESRDEIIFPSIKSTAASDEPLTPASQDNSKGRSVCMLCTSKPSLYTCPRCNVPYCSLNCYKSPEHSICSEDFYKESVLQEIKGMGKTEAEGKKKMQEILIGLRKKAENTEGGMKSLLTEEGFLSEESEQEAKDTMTNVKAIELLSRLAELQEASEENAEEIETILRNLQKIEPGDNVDGLEDEDVKDEDEPDLAERLQGLDIEALSEEQLWSLLDKKEKEKFVGLIKHGFLGGLVSLWKPWWEEHEESGQLLIEVLQESMSIEKKDGANTVEHLPVETQGNKSSTIVKRLKEKRKDINNIQGSAQTGVPSVSAKIPKLSSLCSNPSPLVGFSLINVLFGYAFSLCFFNGDTDSLMYELCDMILAMSEVLNSNKVFNSVQEALDSGEKCILSEGYFDKDDANAPVRAVEAVAHILTGRNSTDAIGYCLSALSQLRSLLSQARASLSKEGEEGNKRQKYFMASKKCEFLQAWVMENGHNIHVMTIELWNEHRKKESEKVSMTKTKSVVEQTWKKGGRRGNCKLVQEL
uniref:Zinc finger, HIT-type containing 2 n=1 Tax=Neogobius melanostomus TaxID=47308 RepID=A0A8C6T0T1_9GOBI